MKIKSRGLPDVVLGARKFTDPNVVIDAIRLARKERRSVDFFSVLKKNLDAELYLVESDFPNNMVTIKSLDVLMKFGNEDEHIYKKALN